MISIQPVAFVKGGRAVAEDDQWDRERARIVLADHLPDEALMGLDTFSHAEIIFHFHLVPDNKVETGARHPRGNPDWPRAGIFAQRGKNRPNRIGVSVCRILSVNGREIEVQGLDAIDATPILDIKPVMREFLPRGNIRQPDWAGELMKDYW
ncbi:SAM-dependent methyltransferase [Hyphomonas sp.]|uniref:SAM-dependent methyltransferase n=1 Tax=Hyphomonas sp. TaxID=87 RepID=UPI00391C1D16